MPVFKTAATKSEQRSRDMSDRISATFNKIRSQSDLEDHRTKFCIGAQIRNSDSGLTVSWVKKGGPSDLAGIRVHDIILQVEGQQMNSLDDMDLSMLKNASKHTVRVTLKNMYGVTSVLIRRQQDSAMVLSCEKFDEKECLGSRLSEVDSKLGNNDQFSTNERFIESDSLSCASTESRISSSNNQNFDFLGFESDGVLSKKFAAGDLNSVRDRSSWLPHRIWSEECESDSNSNRKMSDAKSSISSKLYLPISEIANIFNSHQFQEADSDASVPNVLKPRYVQIVQEENGQLKLQCANQKDLICKAEQTMGELIMEIRGISQQIEQLLALNLKLQRDVQETRTVLGDQLRNMEMRFERAALENLPGNADRTPFLSEIEMDNQSAGMTDLTAYKTKSECICDSAQPDIFPAQLMRADLLKICCFLKEVSTNFSQEVDSLSTSMEQEYRKEMSRFEDRCFTSILSETTKGHSEVEGKSSLVPCRNEDQIHHLLLELQESKALLLLKDDEIKDLSDQIQVLKASESVLCETGKSHAEKELRRMKTALQGNDLSSRRREALIHDLRAENEILRAGYCEQGSSKIVLSMAEQAQELKKALLQLREMMSAGCLSKIDYSPAERAGHECEVRSLHNTIHKLQDEVKAIQTDFLDQLRSSSDITCPKNTETELLSVVNWNKKFSRMKMIAERSVAAIAARDEAMRSMQLKIISAERQVHELQVANQMLESAMLSNTGKCCHVVNAEWIVLLDSVIEKFSGLASCTTRVSKQVDQVKNSGPGPEKMLLMRSLQSYEQTDNAESLPNCPEQLVDNETRCEDEKVYFI